MNAPKKIDRRNFTKSITGALISSSLLIAGCQRAVGEVQKGNSNALIKPPKLRPGDRVGLIAPASFATEQKMDAAISNLQKMGLIVEEGKYLRRKNGFVAGTDGERVEDIHTMFRRDDISGIWCVRGGYGTTRILDMLDYDLIRSHPKAFIGYSDITALHQAFYTQAGMVSFHGPVAGSEFTEYSLASMRKALFEEGYAYDIRPVAHPGEGEESFAVLTSGVASGVIVGGNLTLLSALCGTKYLPDFSNKIVFIEDIGEASYRIDRMLVQLIQAAGLNQAAGIVFGNFTNCGPSEGSSDQSVAEIIRDHFSTLGIPIVTGYSIGHINHQATIAVGMKAELDADKGSIQFLNG